MKKILLGAVACAAFAAPAFAADLPARPRTYTKAPVYTPPQAIYNWTGFYIGGHVGGAFPGSNNLEGGDARFMGGVQGGYDYQFANNWVLGLEANYSWLASAGGGMVFPGTSVASLDNRGLGSVTGRLGFTTGPMLLYAKAWKG